MFVLRADVAIDLHADAREVAESFPSADAHACLDGAASIDPGGVRRPPAHVWLTLREAAHVIGRSERVALGRLTRFQALEPETVVLRKLGAWTLIAAAPLRRYAERHGMLSAEQFEQRVTVERHRALRQHLAAARRRPCWRFSDQTVAYLGGHIEGSSLFARELWATLQEDQVGVMTGPYPDGGEWLDKDDPSLFDAWLHQEMTAPYRRKFRLRMTQRPKGIPPLPRRVRWASSDPYTVY